MLVVDRTLLFVLSLTKILAPQPVSSHHIYDSDDFVFPREKQNDLVSCTFSNGSIGRCVTATDCPNVNNEYQEGINPTLCYFTKEPIVCCMSHILGPIFVVFSPTDAPGPPKTVGSPIGGVKSENLMSRRKSAAACDDVFSNTVPFRSDGLFHITVVGGEETEQGEFPHMVGSFVMSTLLKS